MAYSGIERRKKSRVAKDNGRIPWANAHRLADDCALDLMALESEAIRNIAEGRTILGKGKPQ